MGETIDSLIESTNHDLRQLNCRCTILRRGNYLSLRGTLPPKPGKAGKSHQQIIALGLKATPYGLRSAVAKAKAVSVALDSNSFDWGLLGVEDDTTIAGTVADWIKKAEEEYFTSRDRTKKTETTWRGHYLSMMQRLPQDEPLAVKLIETLGKSIPARQASNREDFCIAMGHLCKVAGLSMDLSKFRVKSTRKTELIIPTDDQIVEFYGQIQDKQPEWLWYYGMVATYGLRPHEPWHLDTRDLEKGGITIRVLENTKTGKRQVWPFREEWIEVFNLRQTYKLPIHDYTNKQLGKKAGERFRAPSRKVIMPWTLYSLRHAWAIRTLRMGMPVELAARQMGHSVAVHTKTYHHWISEVEQQEIYEKIMKKQ